MLVVQGGTDEAEGTGGYVGALLLGKLASHGDGLPYQHPMGTVNAVKVSEAENGSCGWIHHRAGLASPQIHECQPRGHDSEEGAEVGQ